MSTKAENKIEEDYNKLFSRLVKKFDIHSKQSSTDVLIKKGEIQSLETSLKIIKSQIKHIFLTKQRKLKSYKSDEVSLKKFNSKEFSEKNCKELNVIYLYISSSLTKEKNELLKLLSLEKIYSVMNEDLETSILDIDSLNNITEALKTKDMSEDIKIRTKTGKCAFKRPGIKKFPCNEKLVAGEKYCKEHLKQFDIEKYHSIFGE